MNLTHKTEFIEEFIPNLERVVDKTNIIITPEEWSMIKDSSDHLKDLYKGSYRIYEKDFNGNKVNDVIHFFRINIHTFLVYDEIMNSSLETQQQHKEFTESLKKNPLDYIIIEQYHDVIEDKKMKAFKLSGFLSELNKKPNINLNSQRDLSAILTLTNWAAGHSSHNIKGLVDYMNEIELDYNNITSFIKSFDIFDNSRDIKFFPEDDLDALKYLDKFRNEYLPFVRKYMSHIYPELVKNVYADMNKSQEKHVLRN